MGKLDVLFLLTQSQLVDLIQAQSITLTVKAKPPVSFAPIPTVAVVGADFIATLVSRATCKSAFEKHAAVTCCK